MRVRQRDYELMFIISPLQFGEEELNTTLGRVQQAITAAGGEVTSLDQSAPWGRRKLAYPIRSSVEGEASRRPFTEGHYVLCRLSLPTTAITEVERALKLNNAVLRYLLVTPDAKTIKLATVASGSADVDSDEDGDEDQNGV